MARTTENLRAQYTVTKISKSFEPQGLYLPGSPLDLLNPGSYTSYSLQELRDIASLNKILNPYIAEAVAGRLASTILSTIKERWKTSKAESIVNNWLNYVRGLLHSGNSYVICPKETNYLLFFKDRITSISAGVLSTGLGKMSGKNYVLADVVITDIFPQRTGGVTQKEYRISPLIYSPVEGLNEKITNWMQWLSERLLIKLDLDLKTDNSVERSIFFLGGYYTIPDLPNLLEGLLTRVPLEQLSNIANYLLQEIQRIPLALDTSLITEHDTEDDELLDLACGLTWWITTNIIIGLSLIGIQQYMRINTTTIYEY
ncbi:MAG: hypothetical protein QXJ06_04695 [Candidatus Aenigmatarchaeota archaeon]